MTNTDKIEIPLDRDSLIEVLLQQLAYEAVECAPRLFAIYRVTDHQGEPSCAIGWGMDFGEDRGALFGYPEDSTTWHSDSAERLLRRHQLLGDARLHWLTP